MKLRHDIAKSNVANGVEAYLATIAHIDRKLAVRRKIMAAGVTPPAEELQAEIALSKKAIETQDANRYGRADREIGVSVISAEFKSSMAESVADLKRQREQLEDDRTATNAQAKIEIADEQATLLRKYGLL
jgi:hypothetical protein